MTATGSEKHREMEADFGMDPYLVENSWHPSSVPPWLSSLLPVVLPRLCAPFTPTLGTQPKKHMKETRGGLVTNQVAKRSNKGEEGHLML